MLNRPSCYTVIAYVYSFYAHQEHSYNYFVRHYDLWFIQFYVPAEVQRKSKCWELHLKYELLLTITSSYRPDVFLLPARYNIYRDARQRITN